MKPPTLSVWVRLLAATLISATAVCGHHQEGHDPAVAATIPADQDLASRIQSAMESAEIVPDVVGKAPSQLIKVSG